MEKKENGLETWKIVLMVIVALFYDAIQILFVWMGIGWILVPIFYLHFWMWFKFENINFFTPKRIKGIGVGALLEFITAGFIPAFTFNVLLVALDNKIKKVLPGGQMVESAMGGKSNVVPFKPRVVQSNVSSSTPGLKKVA